MPRRVIVRWRHSRGFTLEKKIILDTSDEAAKIETVTGWMSRTGRFWGKDERTARYDGSTHRLCSCGEVIEKQGYCRPCSDKKEAEKFAAMERKEWDGTTPLCLYHADRYFWDIDELMDYCEENEVQPAQLDLVICDPIYAREIDPNEYYCDELAEDGDVPAEIADAFAELNARIKEHRQALSWTPGKFAAILEAL